MRHRTWIALALAGGLCLTTQTASARIKLATLPVRERVEIQLDNGRATLVEEERIVPLLRSTRQTGNNMVDFSWSNTQIDKNSIQFRALAIREDDKFRPIRTDNDREEVSVINVAYPPNENALVWEVYARQACAVKVRVSYLIANLTRTFSYRAVADKDETRLALRNYILLTNYCGEDFGTAGVWAGFGPRFLKLVEQQQDIKMLLHTFPAVPIRKTYTFDWYAHGPLSPDKPLASKVLLHYQLVNDNQHGLGAFPLPPGKVRIFIEDGHRGEAFLGEDWARLTPLDDKLRLYLGEARDVVCTRVVAENRRHAGRGNLYDQELVLRYEIENFKDKPVTLDLVEQINQLARQYGGDPHGDAEWELGERTSKEIQFDFEFGRATPKLRAEMPARPKNKQQQVEKRTFVFHLTAKNLW